MPVPATTSATTRLRHCFSLLVLFFLLATSPLLARGPDPSLRIPLEPLGFQPLSTQFLLAGSSMLTLHYVDDKHLLLTFSTRRLMKRLPDDPPDDQDRHVEAVLLELPSGRILGHTEWRLHDHGQYLWSLGHGRFLLRIRDTLTTFAPLTNLHAGQPFRERPFIVTDRRIGAIMLSPDADLLIVESVERKPPTPTGFESTSAPSYASPVPAASQAPDPTPVLISLFRVSIPPGPGDEVGVHAAGMVRSRTPGRIPATADGYLAIIDQGRQTWAFDFNSYTGKTRQLSPFGSTCRPSPLFVSRSEFIAFGCHSGHSMQVIGAFNMRGEQMWEQSFVESYTAPSFVYAPSRGRFALSRILGHSDVNGLGSLVPEQLSGQSVIVYQTDSGRQILRVDCKPIQRAGQNFALSPDGMSLAIVHADAIEVYGLPPLTPTEQAAVKEAQVMAPEANDAPIRLSTTSAGSSATTESTDQPEQTQTPAATAAPQPPDNTAPSAATDSASPAPANSGTRESSGSVSATAPNPPAAEDAAPPPEERRKPPTLYNSPSDPPPATTTQPK
ncbi:MAG: hypothetical protein JWP98_1379 [Edaphobacter sp.]|nr:hypothetical protein [Edaphobacter sp.]